MISTIVRRAIALIEPHLPRPRVIYDLFGKEPYLSRYYLTGRPRMADGSEPFNETGQPKPEATFPTARIGVYLHRFHTGDASNDLHSHPWRWALSLILAGGYSEERRIGPHVVRRTVKPGDLNFLGADDFHRVDLLEGDAWSLFIVGEKAASWSFWDRNDGTLTPWWEYIAGVRDGLASLNVALSGLRSDVKRAHDERAAS